MVKKCFVHALIFLLRMVTNLGLPALIGLWLSVPRYGDSGGKVRIYRTFYGQWRMNRAIRVGNRIAKRRTKRPRWARFLCFCFGHTRPSPRIEQGTDANGSISFRSAGQECFKCGKPLGES